MELVRDLWIVFVDKEEKERRSRMRIRRIFIPLLLAHFAAAVYSTGVPTVSAPYPPGPLSDRSHRKAKAWAQCTALCDDHANPECYGGADS